jgi:hypothetical protein
MKVQLSILAGMNPELGHHLVPLPGPDPVSDQDAEARRAEILRRLLDSAVRAAPRRTEVH